MIRSMTAYGRAERETEQETVAWELRSVNHRYLDVSLRLPEELRPLEPELRRRIAARAARGKLEGTAQIRRPGPEAGAPAVNLALARALSERAREVARVAGLSMHTVSPLELLRWPGVTEAPAVDAQRLAPEILAALDEALDALVRNREREGAALAELIRERAGRAREIVARVRERLPEVLAAWRERLVRRIEEVAAPGGPPPDPGRLEQEMVIVSQRLDVAEELDRILTHLDEVERALALDEPVGRRLDFLMQELNREANTLGSKASDTQTTQASVELKVLIEQMREQVQNIE